MITQEITGSGNRKYEIGIKALVERKGAGFIVQQCYYFRAPRMQ